MYIELDELEMQDLFGSGNYFHQSFLEQVWDMQGKKFYVVTIERKRIDTCFPSLHAPKHYYNLQIQLLPYVKSPQEIAAEEAVQKAESALKAAKDVLKTVKEK